ncbi:MAG: hypothetical protein LDL53_06415 [Candidatus Hydrogenedens sp.]|nr:hypothetical protein [Candidatus Hydrogenedens sp.]
MENELTPDTLAWICKNAEQAWQEGDPKKLQFWEDQKKEFQKKCYKKIEGLSKQISILQAQQELLIQKTISNEYTPEEANQLSRQIYQYKEKILKQIQFYKQLAELQITTAESGIPQPASNQHIIQQIEVHTNFPRIINVSEFLSQMWKKLLRSIFLTNTGQIILCSIILIIAVYLTWTWNTRNQQPKFELQTPKQDNLIVIRYANHGMFKSKLYISKTKNWDFPPYLYRLECFVEQSEEGKKLPIELPLNCFYINDAILSPLITTTVEVQPGSEKELAIDTQCITRTFPEAKKIILNIKTFYLHKQVFHHILPLEEPPT